MLYGDDDTIFFMDSLMEMVKDFDHNMPYFITGRGGADTCIGGEYRLGVLVC